MSLLKQSLLSIFSIWKRSASLRKSKLSRQYGIGSMLKNL